MTDSDSSDLGEFVGLLYAIFFTVSIIVLIGTNPFYGYMVMFYCEFSIVSCSILLFYCCCILIVMGVILNFFMNSSRDITESPLSLFLAFLLIAATFFSIALIQQIDLKFSQTNKLGENSWLNLTCHN